MIGRRLWSSVFTVWLGKVGSTDHDHEQDQYRVEWGQEANDLMRRVGPE